MAQDVIHVFRLRPDRLRDRLGRRAGLRELRQHLGLQLQDARRGFFPGLDPGLMIGIDVHERAVESDRAFVERNQRADLEGIDLRNADA